MTKISTKIISSSIIASIFIIPLVSVRAEVAKGKAVGQQDNVETLFTNKNENQPIETPKLKAVTFDINATSTRNTNGTILKNKGDNSEITLRSRVNNNNIEMIRERLASTTASTSLKKMEKINERFQKQAEQMAKARERLIEKETKIISVLQKISEKIAERISILETKGLNMISAKAKLALATSKIDEMTTEAGKLTVLIETVITEENKDQLLIDTREIQVFIKTLAQETHSLLVDTVKEITKVLPERNRATSTATTTN